MRQQPLRPMPKTKAKSNTKAKAKTHIPKRMTTGGVAGADATTAGYMYTAGHVPYSAHMSGQELRTLAKRSQCH